MLFNLIFYRKCNSEIDTMIGLKQNLATELTNSLSIFTIGRDSIGVKKPSPSTTIASID